MKYRIASRYYLSPSRKAIDEKELCDLA